MTLEGSRLGRTVSHHRVGVESRPNSEASVRKASRRDQTQFNVVSQWDVSGVARDTAERVADRDGQDQTTRRRPDLTNGEERSGDCEW